MQLFIIWPAANNSEALSLIYQSLTEHEFQIISSHELKLSFIQHTQFVFDLYQNEPWIKKNDDIHYLSLLRKALWCYTPSIPIILFSIQGKQASSITAIKNALRLQIKKGKHSLHAVENDAEAQIIWNSYCSQTNSFHLAQTFTFNVLWIAAFLITSMRIAFFKLFGKIEE